MMMETTKTTKTTYEFWSLAGKYMGTIATNNPDLTASELAHFSGVDADEIEYEEVTDNDNN
jgi:hypothetical protein